ncbi:hypothetical protein BDA96_01G329400 [Sorghum bicolor]|uniref:Citrate transporter-like domain-containing protein n=1 Tax=Sorghum bicolor TaxID=4558 RepID=A0A921S1C7_SORBI|nr:hypothetical protein BDA96_01G329400 [Sorghum bicolor]
MVVGGYLKGAGMFKHLGKLLAWRSQGGRDLLCRVCVVTALASALFTNDTCCVVLTEFVLELAAERNLPAKPFLLALATSANIGSSATPIGNPQNLVIAFNSKITFLQFFFGILPAMLAGMAVNTVMLLCMYWKDLEGADDAGKEMEAVEEGRSPASVLSLKNSPTATATATAAAQGGRLRQRHGGHDDADDDDDPDSMMSENIPTKHRWFMQCSEHRRKLFLKSFAYVVTVGMLVAYMLGLNMSWTAITTAIALVVVDFRDAEPCLDKVAASAATISASAVTRRAAPGVVSTVAGNLSLLGRRQPDRVRAGAPRAAERPTTSASGATSCSASPPRSSSPPIGIPLIGKIAF